MNKKSTPELPIETYRAVYLKSIASMTLAMLVGVGLPSWWAFGLAWGAGLGGMSAVWAGPGYGVMLAGARLALLREQLAVEEQASTVTDADDAPNAVQRVGLAA